MIETKKVTVALTGASGFIYGLRLLRALVDLKVNITLLISEAAIDVANIEMGLNLPTDMAAVYRWFTQTLDAEPNQIKGFGKKEWTAYVASGSGAPTAMVICPASMGTVSAIATGASNNLIERAADVILKEKRQLILMPRETPYSMIHLENFLKLAQLGATILPASPGFYHRPTTVDELVDFIVARILQHLNLSQQLMKAWGE